MMQSSAKCPQVDVILDYCTSVWLDPFLTMLALHEILLKDVRALESPQRHATRLVPMLKDKCYYDCLVSLNSPSLQYQHKHMDMIMTYIYKKLSIYTFQICFHTVIQQLDLTITDCSNSCVILILDFSYLLTKSC